MASIPLCILTSKVSENGFLESSETGQTKRWGISDRTKCCFVSYLKIRLAVSFHVTVFVQPCACVFVYTFLHMIRTRKKVIVINK